MLCRNFSQKRNEFVFLSWRLGNTWNLNLDFKFQVFPLHQDRRTNSFVHFWEKFHLGNYCFKIYWPLVQPIFDQDSTAKSKHLRPQCELYQRMQMHPFHRKCCHDYKLPTYAAPRQSLCRNLTFIFPKEGCDFTSMPKLSSQVALRSFKWLLNIWLLVDNILTNVQGREHECQKIEFQAIEMALYVSFNKTSKVIGRY